MVAVEEGKVTLLEATEELQNAEAEWELKFLLTFHNSHERFVNDLSSLVKTGTISMEMAQSVALKGRDEEVIGLRCKTERLEAERRELLQLNRLLKETADANLDEVMEVDELLKCLSKKSKMQHLEIQKANRLLQTLKTIVEEHDFES